MERSKSIVNRANISFVHETQAQTESHALQSQSNELRLLKYSLIRIMGMKEYNILKCSLKSLNPLVNTIGLLRIAQKFNTYTDLDGFLDDIVSLVRSYSIQFANEPGVKLVVDTLSEQCHRDVKSIRTCAECFERWAIDPDNYFTHVCARPHLIVYAKVGTYPFWPAKVMSINKTMANVAFFGDHTQANVPANNCILYTRQYNVESNTDAGFIDALKELNIHIKNIEKRFGSFNPATSTFTLNPYIYENKLMEMVPGAFGTTSKTSVDGEAYGTLTKLQENPDKIEDSTSSSIGNNPTVETDKSSFAHGAMYTSAQKKRSQLRLKRKSNEPEAMANKNNSIPSITSATKNSDYSSSDVVQSYVKMQFDTLSRRIVELKEEKNRLEQELQEHKTKANHRLQEIKQKILKLKQNEGSKCATCDTVADYPYFCDKICKMYYEEGDVSPNDDNTERSSDSDD